MVTTASGGAAHDCESSDRHRGGTLLSIYMDFFDAFLCGVGFVFLVMVVAAKLFDTGKAAKKKILGKQD